jgi:transmembrane sensor
MSETEALLEKYLNATCTETEKKAVEGWLAAHNIPNNKWEALTDSDKTVWLSSLFTDINEEISVREELAKQPSKTIRLWPRIAITAAAVATIILGVYILNDKIGISANPGEETVNNIAPGKNGATITLANGNVIALSGSKTGVVIGNDLKYNDSSIVQHSSSPSGVSPLFANNMMLSAATNRGQTYQFTLPDGTKVWLNADSKISFPSRFTGKERKIILNGEAYFAVKHNAEQPFKVEAKGQVVEDIGTEFNINAYADEDNTKTTLIEGMADVYSIAGTRYRLKPKNQSTLTSSGQITVNEVDVSEMVAWKNGYFQFNEADLESITKQFSRWYDIDIVFEGKIPKDLFHLKAPRSLSLNEVLKIFEINGINFKIEGRKLIVKS